MVITSCLLHLDLYDVESLKGRRRVINRVKDTLKQYNLSVIDISGDYAKEADIAFVFLSHHTLDASKYREKLELLLENLIPEYSVELEYEEL